MLFNIYNLKYLERDGRNDLVPTSSWSETRKEELLERDWMNLNDLIL